MCKRIVVAGCRKYNDYENAATFIKECICHIKEDATLIFLSGACSGADQIGEQFAREHGYEIEHYPADWSRFGKAAGPKRNQIMAEKCDLLICFWDGKSKGTKSMIEKTKKLGKPIFIKWL